METILISTSQEKKILRDTLEKFTFEEFVKMSDDWITNARFVWFIHGNYDSESAIKIVEDARKILNVKPLRRD